MHVLCTCINRQLIRSTCRKYAIMWVYIIIQCTCRKYAYMVGVPVRPLLACHVAFVFCSSLIPLHFAIPLSSLCPPISLHLSQPLPPPVFSSVLSFVPLPFSPLPLSQLFIAGVVGLLVRPTKLASVVSSSHHSQSSYFMQTLITRVSCVSKHVSDKSGCPALFWSIAMVMYAYLAH